MSYHFNLKSFYILNYSIPQEKKKFSQGKGFPSVMDGIFVWVVSWKY